MASLFKYTVDTLAALGHRPTKKFGQNFLVDGNVVEKFVRSAGVKRGDRVVEIGPGLGTVSAEILKCGAELFAIELDRRLFGFLEKSFGGNENFFPMNGDAVKFPIAALDSSCEDYKIVASLPYSISSAWLDALLQCENLPLSVALIVQLDAANRFLAQQGTKSFGPASIFLQSAYVKVAMCRIGRNSFHPVPAVDSTMLFLKRKERPFLFPQATRQIIRKIFTHRRKQISKIAAGHGILLDPWLGENGLPSTVRPEQIPIGAWQNFQGKIAPN
ncbi:MAG: 16S rRNA (adenine(1518)-N(6)/adenine(1519)-N(6))-dimethyltransferase RsmA [Puniceicoccales bacterium]|jgi:16S rRNA (adenine1518-N6/adenine1519-N6)-dimethyltransferase|nr:16S rRNA (adenine(1518)-N(6)/adenine(1519)-N(6))-dimethyltransferase RsmA [Puniceicoccales bacterium]